MRTLLILLCLLLPAWSEPKQHYTQAMFEAAAAQLHQEPLGNNGREAGKIVMGWTMESHDVEILVGPAIMGLIAGKDEEGLALLNAYAAGQALAQLEHHQKGGYAVEGAREAIAVYAVIRQSKPQYRNAAVEQLIKASTNGTLEKLLSTPAK